MPSLPPVPIVGREQELARFAAILNAADGRAVGMHLIVGEGGVGKTRLTTAVAGLAAARGFTCIGGRAYPVETGTPYALFADAFVPVFRAMSPAQLSTVAAGGMPELATLFPVLRTRETAPLDTDGGTLKPRLLDTFARLLHRMAEQAPVFLALDNLQWADPSSLELLHFIARGLAGHRVCLLGTCIEGQRAANPALRDMERSLRSLGALTVHPLRPLSHEETATLVRHRFDVPVDTVADFIGILHERTRGNPFFLEETLRMLIDTGRLRETEGRWTGWSVAPLELPSTIRDALQAHLARLTPDARHVATIAAVVGTQVPHALLEAMAEHDTTALLHAIDEVRHERVLVEIEAPGELVYEFAHPLLQEVLYTDLSRARTRALHAKIAETLERLLGDQALDRSDMLALHFLRGESPAQAARASRYLIAAGRAALDRGANREAAEGLGAALALTERTPDSDEHETVLDLLARARQRLGDYADAAVLWHRAATLAAARNDMRQVAAIAQRLGGIAFWTGRYDEALAHYDLGLTAASATADDTASARLRLARGMVFLEIGRGTDAESDVHAALAIAERIAEPRLLSRVHQALQSLALWRGPSASAVAHGERALAFATTADDRAAMWIAHWGMAMHAGLTGNTAETARHLTAAVALAEDLRSPLLRLWTAEIGIEYRSGIGAWDEALALADRTIADARAFGQQTLLPRLLVWTSLVHLGRGDFDRAKAHVDEAWTLSGADDLTHGGYVHVHTVIPAHVGRAAWHLARQEYAEALRVGEAGLAIADRTGYVAWAIHRLMPIVAEASIWVKDWERAERYGRRLRESSERLGHPLGLAWADACFALLCMFTENKADAIELLRHAADQLDAIPFVEHAARLRRKLADAYNDSGDPVSAIPELRRVHELFARLQAEPALNEVREKLRSLGARPPVRTPTAAGVGVLTAREAEIARLVAARKSNKEIGAALDISARTVGTHLSKIFTKLGVDSRGALTDRVREGHLLQTKDASQ